jgi:hypothetical protein
MGEWHMILVRFFLYAAIFFYLSLTIGYWLPWLF